MQSMVEVEVEMTACLHKPQSTAAVMPGVELAKIP